MTDQKKNEALISKMGLKLSNTFPEFCVALEYNFRLSEDVAFKFSHDMLRKYLLAQALEARNEMLIATDKIIGAIMYFEPE
jgi:hypothetical protein